MAKSGRGIMWSGTAIDDVFSGGGGNDALSGGGGNDTIDGGAGDDKIRGNEGNDILYGGLGKDEVFGNEGNDQIYGGDGDDYLAGQEGDDLIDGGAGNDFIGAGPGNDTLTGGAGADRFFFASNFSEGMNVHTITDYQRSEGDYIDLKSIDADGISSNNTRKGNTDFVLVEGPSAAAGTAWMVNITDETGAVRGVSIYLNTDADAEADTRIDVMGVTSLNWGTDIIG